MEENKHHLLKVVGVIIATFLGAFLAFYLAVDLTLNRMLNPEYQIKKLEKTMHKIEKFDDKIMENPFVPRMSPMLVNLVKEASEYKVIVDLKPLGDDEKNVDVSLKDNVITISGKGNLSGSVKRNFMVTKAPMSSVEVALQSSYKLTGKSLKVLPTSIKLNGNALTKKDYTIKYRSLATGKMMSSIKTAGSYQLVLTGKGCYQGTKTVDFTVTGANVSNNKPANSTTTNRLLQ